MGRIFWREIFAIVGVSGGPNRGGSAEHLLDLALRIAAERGYGVEIEVEVGFCTDCGSCGGPAPSRTTWPGFARFSRPADGDDLRVSVYFGKTTDQLAENRQSSAGPDEFRLRGALPSQPIPPLIVLPSLWGDLYHLEAGRRRPSRRRVPFRPGLWRGVVLSSSLSSG